MDHVLRFIIGGIVVSFFAILGDALQPKSFAGIAAAAPSVSLATLGLAIMKDGRIYAATEARSMVLGAIAFVVYALLVSTLLQKDKLPVLSTTGWLLLLWVSLALSLQTLLLG